MTARLNRLKLVRSYMQIAAVIGILIFISVYAETAAILPPPPSGASAGLEFLSDKGIRYAFTMLFLIGIAVIGAVILVNRFPKLYVYPVEISAQNIELQFVLAKIMLYALQIVCSAVFSALMISAYRRAMSLSYAVYGRLLTYGAAACCIIYVSYYVAAKINEKNRTVNKKKK